MGLHGSDLAVDLFCVDDFQFDFVRVTYAPTMLTDRRPIPINRISDFVLSEFAYVNFFLDKRFGLNLGIRRNWDVLEERNVRCDYDAKILHARGYGVLWG